MPKRQCSERDGGSTAEPQRQRQLYLILDDWSHGYSIREVDLPSGSSHLSALSGEVAEQRLPRPFFRLSLPRGLPQFFACAFGNRIIAAHPKDDAEFEGAFGNSIPIVDVRKRSLILGPSKTGLYPLYPIYFPIGDRKLFCLHMGYGYLLCRSPQDQRSVKLPSGDIFNTDWSWCCLTELPFLTLTVTSYAVHPAGPSILVSTTSTPSDDATPGTFSFHTELVWKQLGEWTMPFTGRAHYIEDLEIFVGLSKGAETLGHLCFCGIDSLNTSNTQCPAPAWKLCLEKLFSVNPGEEHVSATLVYMGSKSKFCLVECIFFEDVRSAKVLEP